MYVHNTKEGYKTYMLQEAATEFQRDRRSPESITEEDAQQQ